MDLNFHNSQKAGRGCKNGGKRGQSRQVMGGGGKMGWKGRGDYEGRARDRLWGFMKDPKMLHKIAEEGSSSEQ